MVFNILFLSFHSDWIKLNIGGRTFTTTRSTIVAKEPDSMLARMFDCDLDDENDEAKSDNETSHNSIVQFNQVRSKKKAHSMIKPSVMDENGAYLIDRNPEYFETLIGYLRHGNLIIDKHLNPLGILEEAKFYGFYSLIPVLESMILQDSLLQNTIERSIGVAPLTRKEVVRALIQTPSSSTLRFQGVNLSGADLSKLDLSNINFKYAILRGANLQGVNLHKCCLERADISMCNLEGATLTNAHMVCSNLENSVLRGSKMDGQCINELTNLEGANLNVRRFCHKNCFIYLHFLINRMLT